MRTTIIFSILLLFSSTGLAKPDKAPGTKKPSEKKPPALLEVRVKGHYSTQDTQIFKSDKKWVCKTDLVPLFESPSIPYDDKLLATVKKQNDGKKVPAECRDQVFFVDRTGKKMAKFAGCMTDPDVSTLVGRINKSCGR